VQRPIPIWFGGMSPRAYERMGRLADGWFPLVQPGEQLEAARSLIAESAERAGRDPAGIGMEGRVDVRDDVDDTVRRIERWREEGASHVSINTMSVGLGTVDDHLGALEAVAARLPLD
jgi:alkanesulfonate monooxygenase SsuD/methylene tetrahydromethanopterin reductase-like flavin-dependent oxidoreductase (luciferase family)